MCPKGAAGPRRHGQGRLRGLDTPLTGARLRLTPDGTCNASQAAGTHSHLHHERPDRRTPGRIRQRTAIGSVDRKSATRRLRPRPTALARALEFGIPPPRSGHSWSSRRSFIKALSHTQRAAPTLSISSPRRAAAAALSRPVSKRPTPRKSQAPSPPQGNIKGISRASPPKRTRTLSTGLVGCGPGEQVKSPHAALRTSHVEGGESPSRPVKRRRRSMPTGQPFWSRRCSNSWPL